MAKESALFVHDERPEQISVDIREEVGQFLCMLSDVLFLNSRPLMLPVVQFSFAIFYPAIFRRIILLFFNKP